MRGLRLRAARLFALLPRLDLPPCHPLWERWLDLLEDVPEDEWPAWAVVEDVASDLMEMADALEEEPEPLPPGAGGDRYQVTDATCARECTTHCKALERLLGRVPTAPWGDHLDEMREAQRAMRVKR